MKILATIAIIVIPAIIGAQSPNCHDIEGFADSTVVGGCEVFIYATPAIDRDGIPVTIIYERRREEYFAGLVDSVFVHWSGYQYYQAATDSVTLWESMRAYNLALSYLFPDHD